MLEPHPQRPGFWKYAGLVLLGIFVVLFAVFFTLQQNPEETVPPESRQGEHAAERFQTCRFQSGRFQTGTLIPLIAHFIYGLWDTTPMPSHYVKTVEQWTQQGWKTVVWDRESVETLLKKYPVWEALYQSYERKIQGADLARYVVVYDQGGFYFDCDCGPLHRSLKNYMIYTAYDSTSLFFVENVQPDAWIRTTAHRFPIRQGINEHHERLANFSFGAAAQHPALKAILDTVQQRCLKNPGRVDDYGVLYTTGPDAVTDTLFPLRQSCSMEQLTVIDHSPFMKHTMTGTWRHHRDH